MCNVVSDVQGLILLQAEKEESTAAVEDAPFQAPPTVPSTTEWAPSGQPETAPAEVTDWAAMSDSKDVSKYI